MTLKNKFTKIFLLAVLGLVSLSACSTVSEEDLLSKGPESVSEHIAEIMKSGNSAELCSFLSKIHSDACEVRPRLFPSSGSVNLPEIVVETASSGTVYHFRNVDTTITGDQDGFYAGFGGNSDIATLVAKSYESDNGTAWTYEFHFDDLVALNFPWGGSIGDQEIAPWNVAWLLPAGKPLETVKFKDDPSGWLTFSIADEGGPMVNLTPLGLKVVDEKLKEKVNAGEGSCDGTPHIRWSYLPLVVDSTPITVYANYANSEGNSNGCAQVRLFLSEGGWHSD
jgi:hypothetical protein